MLHMRCTDMAVSLQRASTWTVTYMEHMSIITYKGVIASLDSTKQVASLCATVACTRTEMYSAVFWFIYLIAGMSRRGMTRWMSLCIGNTT